MLKASGPTVCRAARSRSAFRAKPAILAFVNDLFESIVGVTSANAGVKSALRRDRFRYDELDRFPVDAAVPREPDLFQPDPDLGVVVGETVVAAAEAVAGEIESLLASAIVRDRVSGISRAAQPADIAILFRSRDSHREFEKALRGKGISTYVYKGLGFFEADEIQDAVALLRYLADPVSDLRAAALLRSRIVRVSRIPRSPRSPRAWPMRS